MIVTAIFSYHRTSIITKRALEQDLARKARHLMKRERPWLFISGKRVAGLRHRIGLGFLWTQARHHGHVISSINANWPRLSKRGSSLGGKRLTAVIEGNDHRGTGGRAVGSVNHPRLYDPAAMANIKAAFYEVWKTVEAQDALRLAPDERELKAAIIRQLIDLVADGTTNPEALKTQVLDNLRAGTA